MKTPYPLVECVPNVSAGVANRDHVLRIAHAAALSGATVLYTDLGGSTERSVITFVAPPEIVERAAFALIKRAAELIDMRSHQGTHPRIGATDVCPFIPLEGVSMEKCVTIARRVARRVAEELYIPTYLYGAAALRPERVRLADVRRGEYEALELRSRDERERPDFGEGFNPVSGATAIGARPILIAFNINLTTCSLGVAKKIASEVRSRNAASSPYALPHCAAIGWSADEFGCAQVSTNLTDFRITPPHIVYDRIRERARAHGCDVRGSHLVGLIPEAALRMAGAHAKAVESRGCDALEELDAGIAYLGVCDAEGRPVGTEHILERVIALRAAD